jgi:hypothetical protein
MNTFLEALLWILFGALILGGRSWDFPVTRPWNAPRVPEAATGTSKLQRRGNVGISRAVDAEKTARR